jgi:hypothetical protein
MSQDAHLPVDLRRVDGRGSRSADIAGIATLDRHVT